MKIGIITIQRASNYGAVLQAYALRTKIESYGHEVELMDYRCNYIESLYHNRFAEMYTFKSRVKNILTWNYQKERNKKFESFIQNRLGCTSDTSLRTKEELRKAAEKYDMLIAGSDQVWSTNCTGGDYTYYLNFADHIKKCSYAASLGTIAKEYADNEELKRYLQDFAHISIREQQAQATIEAMTGRKPKVTLDPTFLLPMEEWKKLVTPVKESNYILLYSLSTPESILQLTDQIAAQEGKEVIVITLNNLYTMKQKSRVRTVSPEEFVSYFYYADGVVTNSFHGTAFSIMFEKKFWVEKNQNPNHDNSRLENILATFGLTDRFANCSQFDTKTEIDYAPVRELLAQRRQDSEDYLSEILR